MLFFGPCGVAWVAVAPHGLRFTRACAWHMIFRLAASGFLPCRPAWAYLARIGLSGSHGLIWLAWAGCRVCFVAAWASPAAYDR